MARILKKAIFWKAIFWLTLIVIAVAANIIVYFLIANTYAYVIYGDEKAVATYRTITSDAQSGRGTNPALSDAQLSESSLSPKDIFLILVSIQIALVVAAGNSVKRIKSVFIHEASGSDLNVLCIGAGGIGKTTLIQKYYGKSLDGIEKTRGFEHLNLHLSINKESHNVTLFDYVGQDFPSLSPEIHSLSKKGVDISLLVIILGLYPVDKDKTTGDYFVRTPTSPDENSSMLSQMLEAQRSQMFTKSTLEMIINNLPNLERVCVIFNQADLLLKINRGKVTLDCGSLYNEMLNHFSVILDEINLAVETHRKTYDGPLPVEHCVASILNGIEFSTNQRSPCIKPITVIEDMISRRYLRPPPA